MKKIMLIAVAAITLAACIKQEDRNTIKYAGETYKTVTLADGSVWMAEPLRYVPEGVEVSDDPSTGALVCYPASFNPVTEVKEDFKYDTDPAKLKSVSFILTGGELNIDKSAATVKAKGLLYSWDVIFGEPVTKDNYNAFENAQGICPEGWHVPSNEDWNNFCGLITGAAEKNTSAVFYDEEYDGGRITDIEAAGWKLGFTGTISGGKYLTNVITNRMSSVANYCDNAAMTYIASSTGKEPAAGKDATQMYAGTTTFSNPVVDKVNNVVPQYGKFPEGRFTVTYANFAKGYVQVRCVKNK